MSSNPYTPPRAAVSDVASEQEYQEVNLWSARGRIGRLRYLAHTTGAYLIAALVVAFASALLRPGESAATLLLIVIYVPMVIFCVMAAIKRSHDMDWNGWTVLLQIIPLIGFIWVFNPGTDGENKYGLPPPPNTVGVKILGFVLPALCILGILAAIAIPAYAARHAAGG
jgi:uncharacterized membrane protein YhaH (DUF805 family)